MEMSSFPIPFDVHNVLQKLTKNLGSTFTLTQLHGEVECQRNKPLLVEVNSLPISITGFVTALKDVDLIMLQPGMDHILTEIVLLHEMSHLLLRHLVPVTNKAAASNHFDDKTHAAVQSTLYRNSTNAYERPQEDAAETLATVLMERICRHKQGLPSTVINMYGFGEVKQRVL